MLRSTNGHPQFSQHPHQSIHTKKKLIPFSLSYPLHIFCLLESSIMSQQSFNAGQTRGQAQEKAEQWTESAKQTAQSARDKTADVAQSARDKAADITHSAQNKSADKSHSTRESAQHGQEQAAGFLGQTGESVKNMAQGALDGVKNSLGMNEKK
ncbi:hypothetical protein EUTSA_v10026478mg [Eutrema salsugineum]|uniref:Uncharacterized protein n=2 Tax=Eutrema salsugineum TaxID=72664 RepID=V4MI84_EUTSA|nr:hypothetical protein EUTSA_v10026478mg [Eutrema salsugineum]